MLEQTIWEREMRRLRVSVRGLIAVLWALGVRMLIDGLTVATALSGAIIALLLLAALLLIRQGHRLALSRASESPVTGNKRPRAST
jgi:hypothetical protein